MSRAEENYEDGALEHPGKIGWVEGGKLEAGTQPDTWDIRVKNVLALRHHAKHKQDMTTSNLFFP
ncbi:MAG: hypothetical protein L3J84_05060 [Gammaproteobacteria bacterium]|nr:hypothetical protein [Gammaproteobacteria bacterium]